MATSNDAALQQEHVVLRGRPEAPLCARGAERPLASPSWTSSASSRPRSRTSPPFSPYATPWRSGWRLKSAEQWGRGEVRLDAIARQVATDAWHVVRAASGGLRAALRSDEPVWREQNAFAAYVHRLMVTRGEAGLGLGAALLAWAEQQAREKRAPLLRLDCVESNEALRHAVAADLRPDAS